MTPPEHRDSNRADDGVTAVVLGLWWLTFAVGLIVVVFRFAQCCVGSGPLPLDIVATKVTVPITCWLGSLWAVSMLYLVARLYHRPR